MLFVLIAVAIPCQPASGQIIYGVSRTPLGYAVEKPVFRVEVDQGVLGQPVLLRLIIENPSSGYFGIDGLHLFRGDERIIPFSRGRYMGHLGAGAREKVVHEIPLLWNSHNPPRLQTPLKPKDRIIFTAPGRYEFTITADVHEGPWPLRGGDWQQVHKIQEDLTIPFTVDVRLPETAAEVDWWAMAQREPYLLTFLEEAGIGDGRREKQVFRAVRKYVKAHPEHPVAQNIDAWYKRIMAARAEAERLNRR